MFYPVRIDGQSWTKDQVSAEEFTKRGFELLPARRVGKLDAWLDSHKVAILFETKQEAAAYAMYKMVSKAAVAGN